MCLNVKTSSMSNPIPVKQCFKMFRVRDWREGKKHFSTTFRDDLVPFGDGHYVARNYLQTGQELGRNRVVNGGYLHSGTQRSSYAEVANKGLLPKNAYPNSWDIEFPAFALDVCAHGQDQDMISRGLYVPALDLRNYTDLQVARLKQQYPGSFTSHTRDVLSALGRQLP